MIKKILQSTFVKMVSALVAVGVLSGAALWVVYDYSTPKIKKNLQNESQKAVKNLFPQMDKSQVMKNTGKGPDAVIKVLDANGKLLGYAFNAEGNGYQGLIKVIAGLSPDLSKLQGIEILESQETPGLGAEIASQSFRQQFVGLSVTHEIEYVKNQKPSQPYEIEAITGATISSRAVVALLNKRLEEVRKVLKGGK